MKAHGNYFQPRPLKRLFTTNQYWTSFLDAGGLCDIEVQNAGLRHADTEREGIQLRYNDNPPIRYQLMRQPCLSVPQKKTVSNGALSSVVDMIY